LNTKLFQKDFITTPDGTVDDLNTINRLHIQKALMALTMGGRG